MNLLNFLVGVLSSYLVGRLVYLSTKNPFKNHYIGDLSNYFNGVENNNNTTNNNTLKISLFYEYKNSSISYSGIRGLKLRNLQSKLFCSEMLDNFKKFQGSKLEDLFDFRLGKIKLLSIISLVLEISYFLFSIGILIAMIYITCKLDKTRENTFKIQIKYINTFINIATISKLAFKLFNVASFVVALILYYQINKSDLDKYDDFLDCDNVNDDFFDEFSEAKELIQIFYFYLVVAIIKQGIERLNQAFDFNIFKIDEEKLSFKCSKNQINSASSSSYPSSNSININN